MSHTAKTEWPENPVPEAVKKVIDTLLETFDNNTEDAGEKLAKYVFTPDAELHSSAGVYHGHAGTLPPTTTNLQHACKKDLHKQVHKKT
jgi:hypothetical protein